MEQRKERLNNMNDFFTPGEVSIDLFAGDNENKENYNATNFAMANRSIDEHQLKTPDSPDV